MALLLGFFSQLILHFSPDPRWPQAVGNATPGKEEYFGKGLPKNSGPHIARSCWQDELVLQLHMAAGLCPASGLGWAGGFL